jgi:hypothetical protein
MGFRKPWSSTQIDTMNYCLFRYHLKYHAKAGKPLFLSAYAKGSLVHHLVENFWHDLGTPEEVAHRARTGKKYYDAESFGKYAEGKWMQFLKADELGDGKRKVVWNYPEEKWVLKNRIPAICRTIFPYLLEEGPPIIYKGKPLKEVKFQFSCNGEQARHTFLGHIDEIRMENGAVVIRDFKTGSPWLDEVKVDRDPQLTLYAAGVTSMAYADREFAKALGLEGEVERFSERKVFVFPSLKQEFFMIEAPSINPEKVHDVPDIVLPTTRCHDDFSMVLKMVERTERAIRLGNVTPDWGRKCGGCDMKHVCRQEADKMVSDPEKYLNQKDPDLFDFAAAPYVSSPSLDPPPKKAVQKKLNFDRKTPPK